MYQLEMENTGSYRNKKKVKPKFTVGLAPSVKKISFGSAGKPSRAAIPAAIVSRNPLIP